MERNKILSDEFFEVLKKLIPGMPEHVVDCTVRMKPHCYVELELTTYVSTGFNETETKVYELTEKEKT